MKAIAEYLELPTVEWVIARMIQSSFHAAELRSSSLEALTGLYYGLVAQT